MGKILKLVIALILTSALQAGDITSTTGVDGYVNRFYNIVLDRTADQGGFDYWTQSLNDKTRAGGDIAKGFFNSQEYMNRNLDDSTFIDICYRAFFGREADAGGKSYWLGILANTKDKQKVLHGFIYSQEFDNLVKSYGILAVMPSATPSAPPVVSVTGTYKGTSKLTSGSSYNCETTTIVTMKISSDNSINGYTNTGLTIDGLVLTNNSIISGRTSDGTVWKGSVLNGAISGTYNWYDQCVGTFSGTKQ